MSLGTYDTHDLIQVIQTLKPDLTPYWLQFFPGSITFEQEFIDFDRVTGTRKLAPFVSPMAQGKVQKGLGYVTNRFKPAYVKPKDVVDPNKLLKRRAGEPLLGSLSLEQRRQAVVADMLGEHRNQIDRRFEWMAARAIIDGSIVVSGEDYPAVTIDFQRNANNVITLTGTDLWTDTTNSNPPEDIEDWAQQIHTTTGYVVTRVTMGANVFKALRAHPKMKDLLDVNYRGSNAELAREPQATTSAKRVGNLGLIELWVYSDVYEADDGTVTQMLDQNYLVMTASEGIQGARCYGAILDKKAGYQPAVYFPKMWEQEDPSVEYLMTQSAPLMVPSRADCTLKAKVV